MSISLQRYKLPFSCSLSTRQWPATLLVPTIPNGHGTLTTDQHTDSNAWGETLNVADRFELTVYDAAYLELAQRRSLPLASLDDELCTAAAALGVALLGRD